MDPTIVWLFLLCINFGLASINYITNGNFDQPVVVAANGYLAGPAYGWNGSMINLCNLLHLGASYGQYIDLQAQLSIPGLLSQTVILPSNGKYIFSFVVRFNDNFPNDHFLTVNFNTDTLVHFTSQNISLDLFIFQVSGFIGSNQVSFMEEGSLFAYGYFIDNVSLIGPQMTYRFNCMKSIDFLKVQALLQCKNIDHFTSLQIIFQSIIITINNLVINYSIVSCQNQMAIISLLPQNQNLILNKINISVPSNVSNQLDQPPPLLLFSVEDLNLSLAQIRPMFDSQLIVSIYSVSQIVMEKTKQIYVVFSTCIASYFLVSIISFWNLALMFNSINISTVPPFTKIFLQKLTFIFYNLSSISDWIGLDLQTLNGLVDLNQISGRQLMNLQRNQNIWFGSFGISSKFFVNNIQSNFMICFSLIKILILFLLRKIKSIPDCLRKKLPIAKIVWKLFLLQSISAQTFMVLSSITTLLDSGFADIREKTNFMIQSLVIMLSFAAMYLYFFVAVEIRLRNYHYKHKNYNQFAQNTYSHKSDRNLKRISLEFYLKQLNSILEFLPMIIVPFFIVFDSVILILSVFLLLFIIRLVWLIRKVSFLNLSIAQKVFTFVNVIFFTLLCLAYLSLYFFEQIKEQPQAQKLGLQQYCEIGGLLIILITLGGGIMQIGKHMILLVMYIINKLQKIVKKIRKSKQLRMQIAPAPATDANKIAAIDKKQDIKLIQIKKQIIRLQPLEKRNENKNKNTNNKNNQNNKNAKTKIKNGDKEVSTKKKNIIFLQNN